MDDAYCAWKGFVDAGLEEVRKGELQVGGDLAYCRVTKREESLSIRFHVEVDGKVLLDVEEDFPLEVSSFQYWAALLARKTVASHEMLNQIRQAVGDEDFLDFLEIVGYGLDNADELPPLPNDLTEQGSAVGADNGNPLLSDSEPAIDDLIMRLRRALNAKGDVLLDQARQCVDPQNLCDMKTMLDRYAKIRGMIELTDVISKSWKSLTSDISRQDNEEGVQEQPTAKEPEDQPVDDGVLEDDDGVLEDESKTVDEEVLPGTFEVLAKHFEVDSSTGEFEFSNSEVRFAVKQGDEGVLVDFSCMYKSVNYFGTAQLPPKRQSIECIAAEVFVKLFHNVGAYDAFMSICRFLLPTQVHVFFDFGSYSLKNCPELEGVGEEDLIGTAPVSNQDGDLTQNLITPAGPPRHVHVVMVDLVDALLSLSDLEDYQETALNIMYDGLSLEDRRQISSGICQERDFKVKSQDEAENLVSDFNDNQREMLILDLEREMPSLIRKRILDAQEEEVLQADSDYEPGREENKVPSLLDRLDLFNNDDHAESNELEQKETLSSNDVDTPPFSLTTSFQSNLFEDAASPVGTKDILALDIRQALNRVLQEKEITTRQLTKHLGESRSTIRRWRRGIGSLSESQYEILCRFLGRGLK